MRDIDGSSVTSGSGSVEITTVRSILSDMVTTASVNRVADPCFDPLADRHVGDATPQPNSTIQVTSSLLEVLHPPFSTPQSHEKISVLINCIAQKGTLGIKVVTSAASKTKMICA